MLPRSYAISIWSKAFLPIIDFLTIVLFYWLAYKFRYAWQPGLTFFNSKQITTKDDFIGFVFIFATLCVLYFTISGMYSIKNKISAIREIIGLALGVFFVMGWFIIFLYFSELNYSFLSNTTIVLSRFLASFGLLFVIFGLYIQRLIILLIKRIIRFNGYFVNRVAIIGQHPKHVTDLICGASDTKIIAQSTNLEVNNIVNLIESDELDEVYINTNGLDIISFLIICERYKVVTHIYEANIANLSNFKLEPEFVGDKIYLDLRFSALEGWGVVAKRIFDIIFSIVFLLIFSPVFVFIIIAIIAEDKGNPFYASERIGPNGKPFNVFKFRRLQMKYCTNKDNSEALKIESELIKTNDMRNDGVLYKIKNDPRSTKVGAFLEKTSLDEIPQVFNVLIGNMSWVGPRPHQPREVEKYKPHHFKVLNIKPGITGLAQVNGRSDLSFDDEVSYDTKYLREWTFALDIKIILKTPLKLLKGHKR